MSRQEEEEPEICYGSIGPADSYLWPAALRKLNRLFNQRHQKEFNVIVIGICKNKKRVTHDEPPLPKELYITVCPPSANRTNLIFPKIVYAVLASNLRDLIKIIAHFICQS
jgi:hypothetical protein